MHATENKLRDYLIALVFICFGFVLGNIPIMIVASFLQASPENLIDEVQAAIGKTPTMALLVMPWIGVFLSFYPIAKYVLKWPITSLFTFRNSFDWKRYLIGFFVWFTINLLTFFITKNDHVLFVADWSKFFYLLVVAVVVLLMQTMAEELVFRSFLIKWLGRRTSIVAVQVIISGVLFGLLHGTNPEVAALGPIAFVYYIGAGLFLGLIAVLDKGIELSSGFHFANNLFAAIIVTSDWQVFKTDAIYIDTNPPAFTLTQFLTFFVGQLIFFLIFWKKYQWNLKELVTFKKQLN